MVIEVGERGERGRYRFPIGTTTVVGDVAYSEALKVEVSMSENRKLIVGGLEDVFDS